MKTVTKKSSKTSSRKATPIKTIGEKIEKAPREKKAPQLFEGKVACTKLFVRQMPQFKNCDAQNYLALNEQAGTVTFINSYNGMVKASFDPATYTYPYKAKVHDKKMEEMTEVDVMEFPSWGIHATAFKRRAKTAK